MPVDHEDVCDRRRRFPQIGKPFHRQGTRQGDYCDQCGNRQRDHHFQKAEATAVVSGS